MKLKPIVATLCVLGMATAGSAFAAKTSLAKKVNVLSQQVAALQAQANGAKGPAAGNLVRFYTPLTFDMLSAHNGVGREMFILKARQKEIADHAIYLGGYAQAAARWIHTIDNSANTSSMDVNELDLTALATINPWTAAYVDLNKNSSDHMLVSKAYLLVGDLAKLPVYGYVGKNDINFGSFVSETDYDYLTPINVDVFKASGIGAGVGYAAHGFNGIVTFMNGGSNGTNLYTANSSAINNFAVNAGYGMTNNGVKWHVGAGYLNGGAFTSNAAGTGRVGVWDINGDVAVANFHIMGEYTQTAKDVNGVAGSGHAAASYFTSDNKKVKGWTLGGCYNFPILGHKSVAGIQYSDVRASSDDYVSEVLVNFRNETFKNIWLGADLGYTKGKNEASYISNFKAYVFDVTATAAF